MRPEKKAIVEGMERGIAGSAFVYVADYRGVRVDHVAAVRSQLHGVGAEFHVVKNRLFRRVVEGRKWNALAGALRGPSAMVTGRDAVQANERRGGH